MKMQRGYSIAEMMVGLFAFSLVLSSIVFLMTRWQQTTSLTRLQSNLAQEAREAIRQIMADVREASYIYHWAEIDVTVASSDIPGHSAFDPYTITTGYTSTGGKPAIPAITTQTFNAGVDLKTIPSLVGQFGLGEASASLRLRGRAVERCSTLALVSLSDGGLARPKYVIYFAAPLPPGNDNRDEIHTIYRLQFQPRSNPLVNTQADTWYPMNLTFNAQPATRSLIIRANAGGTGTIRRVTGGQELVQGDWRIRKLFSTVNRAPVNDQDPSRQFVRGLFYIRQLHPWSAETPISPVIVEAAVIPAQRYGGRITSFPLFDRAYARNVAMPSASN